MLYGYPANSIRGRIESEKSVVAESIHRVKTLLKRVRDSINGTAEDGYEDLIKTKAIDFEVA
jgi:hypothetical protein